MLVGLKAGRGIDETLWLILTNIRFSTGVATYLTN